MLLGSNRKSLVKRRGAAVAELAVLLPFLVFIFLVGTDYCRIFYYSVTITNCARNGAHFGSRVANSQNWQNNDAVIATIQEATVADGATLTPPVTVDNVAVVRERDADGNAVVRVNVTYQFNTLTGFPGIPKTVNLMRTAQLRIAPEAPN
jgi:Flp pilus assembly protein TadG